MAFSYTDPATIPKDFIRLIIGDTDAAQFFMSDEEINAFIAAFPGNQYEVAYRVCLAGAAKFAQTGGKTQIESVSIDTSGISKNFLDLAEKFKILAGENNGGNPGNSVKKFGLVATGISVSQVKAANEDSDRFNPSFQEKQFDMY